MTINEDAPDQYCDARWRCQLKKSGLVVGSLVAAVFLVGCSDNPSKISHVSGSMDEEMGRPKMDWNTRGPLSITRQAAPPEDWSICDFHRKLASHEPFIFENAVPGNLQGLTHERILELAGSGTVEIAVSDNAHFGPRNEDHETKFNAGMADLLRLLRNNTGTSRGDLSFYSYQSPLPGKLQAYVQSSLPAWIPFPQDQVRLWLDVPGPLHFQNLHTDDYQNVYMQLNGTKDFQLIPPWQGHLVRMYDGKYESVSEHWKQTVAKNAELEKVAASWSSMGGDGKPVPNLTTASRIVVTLRPGDLLVLPALWWHTTLSDGLQSSMAVNVWFSPRQPLEFLWWRLVILLKDGAEWRRRKFDKESLKDPWKEVTNDEERAAKRQLLARVRHDFPWLMMRSGVAKGKPASPDQMPRHAGEANKCIRWSFNKFGVAEKLMKKDPALKGVDISRLLDVFKAKAGSSNKTAWHTLRNEYLDALGGEQWQSLGEWRRNAAAKFKSAIGSKTIDALVEKMKHWFGSDSSGFFGFFVGCDEPGVTPRKLRCEAAFRVVAQALAGACRCEVKPCAQTEL